MHLNNDDENEHVYVDTDDDNGDDGKNDYSES